MTVPQYFGPHYLKQNHEKLITTPVGEKCTLCEEKIVDGDAGSINVVGQITHYECLLRAVVGSTAHQQYQCSCYGGKDDDHAETGLTYRQGAIQAADLYRRTELLKKERDSDKPRPHQYNHHLDNAFWGPDGERSNVS